MVIGYCGKVPRNTGIDPDAIVQAWHDRVHLQALWRLRARSNLLSRLNLICPVQSHSQKYFPSPLMQITSISTSSRPT